VPRVADEDGEEVVARGEVAVERRPGHAHGAGDAGERERLDAVPRDLAHRVLLDLRERLRAQPLTARGSGRGGHGV
jgi:hypothetical protein